LLSYVLDTDPFRQIGFNKMSSISVMLIFNSPLSIFSFKKMSQLEDICKKKIDFGQLYCFI